jgi:predicted Ser/Thr protein kinase
MQITDLKSKKNSVRLIVDDNGFKYIKKTFLTKQAFDNEFNALNKMNGSLAPKVYKAYDLTVEKEYIAGQNFLDALLSAGVCKTKTLARALASFFKKFHELNSGLALDDLNFHNFLLTKPNDSRFTMHDARCVYCIDFEDTASGDLTDTLSKTIAFLKLYEFGKLKKAIFIKTLCKFFEIKCASLNEKIEEHVVFLKNRRGLV